MLLKMAEQSIGGGWVGGWEGGRPSVQSGKDYWIGWVGGWVGGWEVLTVDGPPVLLDEVLLKDPDAQ